MGSNARGGITRSGASGSYTYATRTNMGDKPVNYVSWFDAARVSNWLMNGGTSSSSTETGAYTLIGGQTSGTAPAVNSGATVYIPTEDQWYKAAYYKGGSTNAGYWDYGTQSDSLPTAVTAGLTGIGSSGSTGNFANYNSGAGWNGQDGNVTTVGTNGGASAYGAFDMSGNVYEWNDLTGATGSSRGRRGGSWANDASDLSSSLRSSVVPSDETSSIGFRLASPVAVPEPSTCAMALAGLACGCYALVRRRRRNPGRERFSAPGLIEPRDHGADPGVFRPHTVAESPSSAPVPGFRGWVRRFAPVGRFRWGESLHPPDLNWGESLHPRPGFSRFVRAIPDWCFLEHWHGTCICPGA
jgi:hypothetical protein